MGGLRFGVGGMVNNDSVEIVSVYFHRDWLVRIHFDHDWLAEICFVYRTMWQQEVSVPWGTKHR